MARKWESVIIYEDRAKFHTSRLRLLGVNTREASGAANTDNGVMWLQITNSGDTATVNLYKDDGLDSSDKVATGTADVSSCDNTGENAAEVTLTEDNSSGMTGAIWIHEYTATDSCPVQVALCIDEDLDTLWDGIEELASFDATYGMAEFIRMAGDDVVGKVLKMFADQVGGHSAAEAWYITDAERTYPDLRCIANAGQLRLACACRALELALGREHQRADDTAYSTLRDKFGEEYERAMASLTLAFKSGGGDNARVTDGMRSVRLSRA